MAELEQLVTRAQTGDIAAFTELVARFQDMACGYAHSILGDFHMAEDAAQEAFVEAYRDLPKLREPAAFPGWLRRIVFKYCDRLTRRKQRPTIALETAPPVPGPDPSPAEELESRDMKDRILAAIRALPDTQRVATTLFYIDGYSQREVAEFLDVPETTVKSRLRRARARLQKEIVTMTKETLHQTKAGPDYVDRLREKLMGQIVELADGRLQVWYDFVGEKQFQDWQDYGAADPGGARVEGEALAFDRIDPADTPRQFSRDIRLRLVFDRDGDLEVEYDLELGVPQPWTSAAWLLTRRDGYGPGIANIYGCITDWDEDWRRKKKYEAGDIDPGNVHTALRYYPRNTDDAGANEEMASDGETAMAERYHVCVSKQGRSLRYTINGEQTAAVELTDEQVALTERLVLCNYGKGQGARFRNVVIRCSGGLELDSAWPAAEAQNQ